MSSIVRESRLDDTKQDFNVEYDAMNPYGSSIKKRREDSEFRHQDSLKSLVDEFVTASEAGNKEKSKLRPQPVEQDALSADEK